jgi:hypothetical protein
MKSYSVVLVLIILFLSVCPPIITANSLSTQQINDNNDLSLNPYLLRVITLRSNFISKLREPFDDFIFNPQEMTLQDDAYHGSDGLHYTEWWYFDATFDNGYSTQMSVRILSALGQGVVISRLDLYYHGELVQHTQKRYLLQQFIASKIKPDVVLNGNHVIIGSIDPITNDWVYNISFNHGILSATLQFTGITEAWKGQLMGGDWWGVALPRANVTGEIEYLNETITCEGYGYHDHNWEVTLAAGLNFGWIWGKMHSEHYTMTWSTIYKTRFWGNPIIVINENYDGYINIHPDNIKFKAKEINYRNGRFIPLSFIMTAQQDDITIDINMEVLEVHHVRIYAILNYWRYHIHCSGSISIGDSTDYLDDIFIAELIRFR